MHFDDQATPQEIVDAWVAMGHAGDVGRVMKAIEEIEEVVRELGRSLERLQHPEGWDNAYEEFGTPLQFIKDNLADADTTAHILQRLAQVRVMLERALPRPDP